MAATSSKQLKNICVLSGFRYGKYKEFVQAAIDLGCPIAERQLHLVYGGGDRGLLKLVSEAAFETGQKVEGLKLESGSWKVETGSFKIGFGWRGFGLQAADWWPRLTAGWTGLHLAADRCFAWELAAADRGDADGSRLTAGRDFTWQQQIVISSAVGSNRSHLVVADWWLQTCGLRLPCSVLKLFVFV
ncbi:hypothetical protein WN944_026951 [Citrus x changshan-huyou]|uniref:Uncharacterized protein n=1 Tax=Citrus x changshan-huyou TaxID=2935761 RepID=A0AAP0Q7R6_9ROSI